MKYLKFFLILLFVISGVTNCSKGKSDPLTNDLPGQIPVGEMELGVLPVLAFDGSSAIGLLGLYEMSVSSDGADVNVMPSRSSLIGESFVVSGDAFFTTTPCRDCLRIDHVGFDNNGNIIAGLSIKHPFKKGNPAEPSSGLNRLDLDIFDVAVVVNPIGVIPSEFTETGVRVFSGIVINPDGYTNELTEVINDDAIRPYKICYESPENNRFRMGTDRQEFEIIIAPGALQFELYVTMGYGASAKKIDRMNPEYYIPEFNRKASWKVDVSADPWFAHYPNTVTIDIYDWNHGATVSDSFPDKQNPDHIWASSDITDVTVEVPGMTDNIIHAISFDTSTNGWDDPITYIATFTNENDLDDGVYTGLVKVLDSRIPGEVIDGGEFDTLVDTIDGIELQWLTVPEFATYQTFNAIVNNNLCGPISGNVIAPECPYTEGYNNQLIDFEVHASSAGLGNPIVLYEIDTDYDGVTFGTDFNSNDGHFEDMGPFNNPNCGGSNEPVNYTVAFRATDSCDPPNIQVFATCDVTIKYCCGPIMGEVVSPICPVMDHKNGATIDFVVSAASPNGGDPVYMYQADWDYDGVIFDIDDYNNDGVFENGGPFVNPNCGTTDEPYTIKVAFRAIDSCDPPNISIFATCDVTVICHGPYGWARSWGGYLHEEFMGVAADAYGNVYATGTYGGTIDFDPGTGTYIRTSNGRGDCFVSKFDSWGEFLGARVWGGTDFDYAYHVDVDKNQNVLVSGEYGSVVDFDPGPGIDIHTSNGMGDIFLSKFDGNGLFMWADTWGGASGRDWSSSLKTDIYCNAFVMGCGFSPLDFDPGPGIDKYYDGYGPIGFISKIDWNGDYHWSKKWRDYENQSFTFDDNGDIYLTARTSEGGVLAKLDQNGNIIWFILNVVSGEDMEFDSPSTIYVTGLQYHDDIIDFDPGSGEDLVQGPIEFLTKFDTSGNYYWTKTWSSSGNPRMIPQIALNSVGEVYIYGIFGDSVDLDPGPDEDLHTPVGLSDIYLSKFDSMGNFISAHTWGSEGHDRSADIEIDRWDNIYLVGDFQNTMDFAPGPGEYLLTPDWGYANFLIKLLPNGYWE